MTAVLPSPDYTPANVSESVIAATWLGYPIDIRRPNGEMNMGRPRDEDLVPFEVKESILNVEPGFEPADETATAAEDRPGELRLRTEEHPPEESVAQRLRNQLRQGG